VRQYRAAPRPASARPGSPHGSSLRSGQYPPARGGPTRRHPAQERVRQIRPERGEAQKGPDEVRDLRVADDYKFQPEYAKGDELVATDPSPKGTVVRGRPSSQDAVGCILNVSSCPKSRDERGQAAAAQSSSHSALSSTTLSSASAWLPVSLQLIPFFFWRIPTARSTAFSIRPLPMTLPAFARRS